MSDREEKLALPTFLITLLTLVLAAIGTGLLYTQTPLYEPPKPTLRYHWITTNDTSATDGLVSGCLKVMIENPGRIASDNVVVRVKLMGGESSILVDWPWTVQDGIDNSKNIILENILGWPAPQFLIHVV